MVDTTILFIALKDTIYNTQSYVTDTAVDLLCFLHFPKAVFWCIPGPGGAFPQSDTKLSCFFFFNWNKTSPVNHHQFS